MPTVTPMAITSSASRQIVHAHEGVSLGMPDAHSGSAVEWQTTSIADGPLMLLPPLDDVIIETFYRDLADIDRSITSLFRKLSSYIPIQPSASCELSQPQTLLDGAPALHVVPKNITLIDQFRRLYAELESLRIGAHLEPPASAILLRRTHIRADDSELASRDASSVQAIGIPA